MAIWNGKKFVDALPQTSAAEARVSGKTTDAKDCGCSDKTKKHATVDRAWKRAQWTDSDGVVLVHKN